MHTRNPYDLYIFKTIYLETTLLSLTIVYIFKNIYLKIVFLSVTIVIRKSKGFFMHIS